MSIMWLLVLLESGLLLLVTAVNLNKLEITEYQLQERTSGLDSLSKKQRLKIHQLLPSLKLISRLVQVTLAVVLAVTLASFHPGFIAILISLVILSLVYKLSRFNSIQSIGRRFAKKLNPQAINLVESTNWLWSKLADKTSKFILPDSESELIDQITRLPTSVLDYKKKHAIKALISSSGKTAEAVMTKQNSVTSVKASSTLGPILLAKLQKTKHGYFPVLDDDEQPIGLLNLPTIGDLHKTKSQSQATEFMSEQIIWVNQEDSLEQVVTALIEQKQYVCLVQNEQQEFVGLITMTDVLKHLVGLK